MSALRSIYNAAPVTKYQVNKPSTNATTPEVVAGYIRLVFTVLGTLATLLPTLEVMGVPIAEWIGAVFGATCQ